MAYLFEVDSVLRELKKHYFIERFYTSTFSQCISLDKNSVFFTFRMVNISQNIECESNNLWKLQNMHSANIKQLHYLVYLLCLNITRGMVLAHLINYLFTKETCKKKDINKKRKGGLIQFLKSSQHELRSISSKHIISSVRYKTYRKRT